MTEAQATGTPVIAFNRGAAPELVQNGKTGFLVNTLNEMVEKMNHVDTLKREDCRTWVEKKFSNAIMADGYLQAYQTVIDNWDTYTKNQWKILREEQTQGFGA